MINPATRKTETGLGGIGYTFRAVRVTPEFFRHLDAQLPPERGHHGEPTAAEFAASDWPLRRTITVRGGH